MLTRSEPVSALTRARRRAALRTARRNEFEARPGLLARLDTEARETHRFLARTIRETRITNSLFIVLSYFLDMLYPFVCAAMSLS